METSAGSKSRVKPEYVSTHASKDKRYIAQVEKAIATFHTLEEWADYITFLSRLQKSLDLPAKPRTALWIPLEDQVLNKLALCLSPQLPSGVHQKALALYAIIFDALTIKELNKLIIIWLPGLLLILSYGSTQVKPQLLSLYRYKLLDYLDSKSLKLVTKPFILSLLSGLDDENSEIYNDCLHLLELFKDKLGQNSHFWQEMFMCIITSPEKRMGALNWCQSHLPIMSTIALGQNNVYSSEAQACLVGKGGLLIRAFVKAFETETSFNPATDIVVIRGFFDLLLAKLPLNSPVLTHLVSESDKQLLIKSCVQMTLKKEMSLNRRLWAWFLGPNSATEVGDSNVRKEYFSQHALAHVQRCILCLLESSNPLDISRAIRMSLSLIIDKWEISQLVTPLVFSLILQRCKSAFDKEHGTTKDIMLETKLFFNQVETIFIWRYITCNLIPSDNEADHNMLLFVLKQFDVPDDQNFQHIHLAILMHLEVNSIDDGMFMPILEALVSLARPELLSSLEKDSLQVATSLSIKSTINEYYQELTLDENAPRPLSNQAVTYVILRDLKSLYLTCLKTSNHSLQMSLILSEFVYSVPHLEGHIDDFDQILKNGVLHTPVLEASDMMIRLKEEAIFSILKLTRYLVTVSNKHEKSSLLKIMLSSFWAILGSPGSTKNRVEAVKCLFELSLSFSEREIEAGIIVMILNSPVNVRFSAFQALWAHSIDIPNALSLLSNPLFVLLDGLRATDTEESSVIGRFISCMVKENSAQRLIQVITYPLITLLGTDTETCFNDDIILVNYHIQTLRNAICSNKHAMKEVFNYEFMAPGDLSSLLSLPPEWIISSNKSLIVKLCESLLQRKIDPQIVLDPELFSALFESTAAALDLLKVCISGSDSSLDGILSTLIQSSSSIFNQTEHNGNFEPMIVPYLLSIQDVLKAAKALKVNLENLDNVETDQGSKFTEFMTHCLLMCNSPEVLETWFSLCNYTLHVIKIGLFEFMLKSSSIIISKLNEYYDNLKSVCRPSDQPNRSESMLILLEGLESILIILHSHIMRSSLSASSNSSQGDVGFLGNVISGVFQIEAPNSKSEDEKKTVAVKMMLSKATSTAFSLYDWSDNPRNDSITKDYSHQTIKVLTNRVRFRSKKLLECICELDRQRAIETIIAQPATTAFKIKVLHVLDSGRAQISAPHILDAIRERCLSLGSSDEMKVVGAAGMQAQELSAFLPKYLDSVDYDIIEEMWEELSKFLKEALTRAPQYYLVLADLLEVLRSVANKTRTKKFNHKEVTSLYLSYISTILTKMLDIMSSNPIVLDSADFYHRIISHVRDLNTTLQEQDKISTILASIINTMVSPKIKNKLAIIPPEIPDLLKAIGESYPVKAWKQVIHDIFMDSSFFKTSRFDENVWKAVTCLWITNDLEKITELIAKIGPLQQSSTPNIFLWNDSSEILNTILCLKRIAYLIIIKPVDCFGPQLNDLVFRVMSAWNSTRSPKVQSEILNLIRAITLRFSDSHLLPHWEFITQSLAESIRSFLTINVKDFTQLGEDKLGLFLSACKLLDQLLLLNFDEFNSSSWIFVGDGSINEDVGAIAYVDRLAKKVEPLMSKDTPILISQPQKGEICIPLLLGIRCVDSVVMLKVFLGLLSYVNYERTYGLCVGSTTACEKEVLADLAYFKT